MVSPRNTRPICELREQAHQQIEQLQAALDSADEERSAAGTALEDAVMDLEDADLALEEAGIHLALDGHLVSGRRRGWAVGAFGTLLTTTDGGQHWRSQAD